MNSFEELLTKIDAQFYKSYMGHRQANIKPVFFYHVKKTGGMSINYSLLSAQLINGKLPPLRQVYSYKYDNVAEQQRLLQEPLTSTSMVMSHLNFGAHAAFKETFDLVTLLRDPFKRVLSNYTYSCMRKQQKPSLGGFETYFNAPEHINVMNRQLSPVMAEIDAETTFAHLQSEFTYFGTTLDINLFIEYFISRFQLPNVLMPRMNETIPKYRLNAAAFQEQVLELNKEDVRLYQYVRARPRLPKIHADPDNVSALTSLQYEVENEVKSRCRTHVVPTQALFNHLIHWVRDSQEDARLTVRELLSSS